MTPVNKMEEGIIVGADQRQEWLLPWWWSHFSKYNRLSVAFFDFGLSPSMREWCSQRGILLSLPKSPIFVKDRDEVDPLKVESWEKRYPDTFWEARNGWFKKPLACAHTPYQRTAWIDLDCEVVGSLTGLLGACDSAPCIALAKDRFAAIPKEIQESASSKEAPQIFCSERAAVPEGTTGVRAKNGEESRRGMDRSLNHEGYIYNSGVIAFQKEHPLILDWARQAVTRNGEFRGDQDLLSQIIFEQKVEVHLLPPEYNWPVGCGEEPGVMIYHWLGEAAKAVLRNQVALENFSQALDSK
jgi:hypothetical protein